MNNGKSRTVNINLALPKATYYMVGIAAAFVGKSKSAFIREQLHNAAKKVIPNFEEAVKAYELKTGEEFMDPFVED